ncbi:hypothetical protein [Pseudoalteromonas piratica]|uniref:Uncharacterized protein n=1 Tax=Pseudoalteromonas piratica TaxID=1348114 RepID=A0A0A7EJA0_9GAMM|nr:hypothetical protein [Pseudoalteromonas piratica]AIY66106.1 hypothetical protein OM33_14030 [Pseudoalteromonas piratica]
MKENLAENPYIFSVSEVAANDEINYVDVIRKETKEGFKALLPEKPKMVDPRPRRIAIFDNSGNKHFVGPNDNIFNSLSEAIFLAIADGMISDYFNEQAKTRSHVRSVRDFLIWLNTFEIDPVARYDVLNQYEAYCINERKLLPQSTGLDKLIPLIKHGLGSLHLSDEQYYYLIMLLNSTTLSEAEGRTQFTLSSWFSLPWIRPIMGEKSYLKLESAKILMDSFKITVGTVLQLLLCAKQEINSILTSKSMSAFSLIDISKIESSELETIDKEKLFNKVATHARRKYSNTLFWIVHEQFELRKSQEKKKSPTYRILKLDTFSKAMFSTLEYELSASPLTQPPLQYSENNVQLKQNFNCPLLFEPNHLEVTNPLEELLAAWIISTLCIQPSDVSNGQIGQFIREYNNSGSLISIFSQSYKSRSDTIHSHPILDGQLVESKALESYFANVEKSRENLFSNNKIPAIRYVTRNNEGEAQPSYAALLTRILDDKVINKLVVEEHQKRDIEPIFLKAFLALDKSKAPAFDAFYQENRDKIDEPRKVYTQKYSDAVPVSLFKLSHIKNSSVHSRYDQYREGDLVNQNSHNAEVERLSYIGEANKDAVNQRGRISRLVMNDLSENLYKPSIDKILKKARDMQLQTSLRKASQSDTYEINTLGIAIDAEVEDDRFGDQIVFETQESALNMIHYLSQVEKFGALIAKRNLPFFESEVLPRTLWIEDTLQRFSNKSLLAEVYKKHKKLESRLPDLFESELQGGVA